MLALFAAAFAVQVGYGLVLARGLARAEQQTPASAPDLPLSVVVAARNEEPHLPDLLDTLGAQTHPAFEVIVVDDASDDGTAALVEARAAEDARFRLVRVAEPEQPRKKHALTLGVAAARHDRLVFTDADCAPPAGWLSVTAAHAAAEPEAVLVGFGPYRKYPGALNRFVRYETLVTAWMAAAAVGWGRPFLAVGRNFSYPQRLFERLGGFAHSARSLSGDDDLLVQEAHRHGAPVRYVLDPASFVPSEPPRAWRAWARQKRRHTSAGRFYSRSAQAHLLAFHASNLGVWLAPVFLGWTGAGLLAARLLLHRAALRPAARAFRAAPDLLAWQPALELGYLLYNTLLAPLGALRVPKRW